MQINFNGETYKVEIERCVAKFLILIISWQANALQELKHIEILFVLL